MENWRKGPTSFNALTPAHGRGIVCMDLWSSYLATGS